MIKKILLTASLILASISLRAEECHVYHLEDSSYDYLQVHLDNNGQTSYVGFSSRGFMYTPIAEPTSQIYHSEIGYFETVDLGSEFSFNYDFARNGQFKLAMILEKTSTYPQTKKLVTFTAEPEITCGEEPGYE